VTSEVVFWAFEILSVGTFFIFYFVQNILCVLSQTVIYSTGLLYSVISIIAAADHSATCSSKIVLFETILNECS